MFLNVILMSDLFCGFFVRILYFDKFYPLLALLVEDLATLFRTNYYYSFESGF